MKKPAMTVLLCTVRPYKGAYTEHPEWGVLHKVFEDLGRQTFQDFELVVVDGGVFGRRVVGGMDVGGLPVGFRARYVPPGEVGPFPVWHVAPRDTLWTRNRKIAISTFRNTGIAFARGDWIVNLDDCCILPPDYLKLFHAAHVRGQALGACWINHPMRGVVDVAGGVLRIDPAAFPPPIYGFGSYPRGVVLDVLNGYDEAFDGGQGLEDADFGSRLLLAGVPYWLAAIPGFTIEPQSRHDPAAIDLDEPVVKCPNVAWQIQRMQRQTVRANCDWPREMLEKLISPCWLLNADGTCQHHSGVYECAYLKSFAKVRHPLAAKIFEEPPVFSLRGQWDMVQTALGGL